MTFIYLIGLIILILVVKCECQIYFFEMKILISRDQSHKTSWFEYSRQVTITDRIVTSFYYDQCLKLTILKNKIE